MSDNFFDKYDLYVEGDSQYCYAGSYVLKNKLGIRDAETFKRAEAEISYAAMLELQLRPISGGFDKAHLYAVHKFLFEGFYDFAGKTRKEDISKGNTKFCVWLYIDDQLNELFSKIKKRDVNFTDKAEVCDFLSYVMAELNVIHPFREGNGRAVREFIREYALSLGYNLDWSRADKNELLNAMIESVFNTSRLKTCLNKCLS
ncbi:MAG: Fic family protein [Roseburia sp.]|nr:Fic family protein [Roseburia sp.]